jgi:hypothetical protein
MRSYCAAAAATGLFGNFGRADTQVLKASVRRAVTAIGAELFTIVHTRWDRRSTRANFWEPDERIPG